jgi:hypothetical protein
MADYPDRLFRLSWRWRRRSPVNIMERVLVQTGPGVGDDGQMPRFVPVEEQFKGRHFNQEIVVICVRWYLNYKLSYRDLLAMMNERRIDLAHTTTLRWVQHLQSGV